MFLDLSKRQLLEYLNNEIKYGFIDKNNKIYKESELDSKDWINNYTLQSNKRLLKTKIGHCWDFVELERFYFDSKHIKNKTFFICDKNLKITHTFLIYFLKNKIYYIESAWYKYKGIYSYKSEKECLSYIGLLFYKNYHVNPQIHHYDKPKNNINQFEFIDHVFNN